MGQVGRFTEQIEALNAEFQRKKQELNESSWSRRDLTFSDLWNTVNELNSHWDRDVQNSSSWSHLFALYQLPQAHPALGLPSRPCFRCGAVEPPEPHYCYRIEPSSTRLQVFGRGGRSLYRVAVYKDGREQRERAQDGIFEREQAEQIGVDLIARFRAHDELVERGFQDAADLVWRRR